MKTTFVVRVIDKDRNTIGGYVRELDLPFVPTIGMRLNGGTSTWLWETIDGKELRPQIKDIVYDIDEEEILCLFEIDKFLAHGFWIKIKEENLNNSLELSRFELH